MRPVRGRLVRISSLGAVALLTATAAASAQDPVLRFDTDTPATLGLEPVVAAVFNDGPETLRPVSVTASLDPPAANADQSPLNVPVEVDAGSGFESPPGDLGVPAAGRIRLRLVRPEGAVPGATGWVTVTASSSAGVVVARRALAVEGAALKPAVTTWKVTSGQRYPWSHDGGDVGSPLPLDSACASATGPTAYVVDRDQTIAISSTCDDRKLQLRADRYPGPGTYTGKLTVGVTAVDVEVRRTMVVWWPIAMILLGVLLALWTQGQLDSALRTGQWLAIRRLRRGARTADIAYAEKADGTPWETYELEKPMDDAAAELDRQRAAIARGLRRPFRWLPWPDGYMEDEREALRTKLAALEQLVVDWPSLPDDFSAAQAELMKRPHAVEHAPELVARALILLGAAGGAFDTRELETRRDEARALPAALATIDEFVRVRDYLARYSEPPPADWAEGDRAALVRARQYVRQASAMLAVATDATIVEREIGLVLVHATRSASRVPEPTARQAGPGEAIQESAADTAGPLPILGFGRILEAIRVARVAAGPAAVIFLSVAIGVLTGLGALYFGKAWGTLPDYAAALVWGYVAATITGPIIATVKNLGTRAGDAAPASGK